MEQYTVANAGQAQAQALIWHKQLLGGSRVTPDFVANAFWEPLQRDLKRMNPGFDEHFYAIAASEALLSYLSNPVRYDPAKLPLYKYLRMAASGDFKNLLSKEDRHRSRRVAIEAADTELPASRRDDPVENLVRQEEIQARLAAAAKPVPPVVLEGLSPGETEALALLRQRERRTAAYAEVLGLDHLPPGEQAAAVKRVKDKLQKRIQRAGEQDG